MSIFVRLWLAMATVLLAGAWLTVSLLQDEVRPSVRQALEETLADNANLAAVLVADDLREGRVGTPAFSLRMQGLMDRQLKARIWEFDKSGVTQRLYITDARGIVLFDSAGKDTGKDYSRWNDVRRTLKGEYGARSSPSRPGDPESSVMYVAAPVMDGNRIIGVLTLGKAGVTVQPFIDRSRDRMLRQGGWVVALTLLVAALAAWWLRHGIHRVAAYARNLGPGRAPLRFRAARELNELVAAIDTMRSELEGKAHVEKLAQTLTHELKSPLTAIRASTELLRDDLPPADRERFLDAIEAQTERLQHLATQMLLLARLEAAAETPARQRVDPAALIRDAMALREPDCVRRGLEWQLEQEDGDAVIHGDPFWLGQALANVIANALDFMPDGETLVFRIGQSGGQVRLSVFNPGPPVPEYALTRLFDRFYTLPRPDGRRTGSGLGLTLVREVMQQSGGEVQVRNRSGGVEVVLLFPG